MEKTLMQLTSDTLKSKLSKLKRYDIKELKKEVHKVFQNNTSFQTFDETKNDTVYYINEDRIVISIKADGSIGVIIQEDKVFNFDIINDLEEFLNELLL